MKIDIHTHTFNFNFVPVAGVIRAASGIRLGIKMPVFICNLVEVYFQNHTLDKAGAARIKPDATYQEITAEIAEQFNVLSLTGTDSKSIFSRTEREILQEAIENYGDYTLEQIGLSGSEAAELGLNSDSTIEQALAGSFTADEKSFSANPAAVLVLGKLIKWALQKLYKKFLKSYIDWFRFMTGSYTSLAQSLYSLYSEIDIFIHHDMDMENWYELAPPKYSYEPEQVDKISELARNSKGKLLPFYAYDPHKGIGKLKEAIAHKGYAGVKFYPPSGYRAIGNDTELWNTNNKQLYTYCVDNSIPLFTHCNDHGMEAYKGAGKNSHPGYWAEVLADYPDLTLCLGHAGGENGWFNPDFSGDDNDYAEHVYKLCVRYENVYCDMGYFPGIYRANGVEKLRKQLLSLFSKPLNGNDRKYDFSEKILYGSDWHMLMQENNYQDYFPKFKQVFEAEEHKVYEERFFYKNAIKYLRLDNYADRNRVNFLTNDAERYLTKYILGV